MPVWCRWGRPGHGWRADLRRLPQEVPRPGASQVHPAQGLGLQQAGSSQEVMYHVTITILVQVEDDEDVDMESSADNKVDTMEKDVSI